FETGDCRLQIADWWIDDWGLPSGLAIGDRIDQLPFANPVANRHSAIRESAVCSRQPAMTRVLLLSHTTGYQLRAFNEAAEALGIGLVFATDRCHLLDDPWQDRA